MVIIPSPTLVGDFPFHFAVGERSFISIILKMLFYVVVGTAFPNEGEPLTLPDESHEYTLSPVWAGWSSRPV